MPVFILESFKKVSKCLSMDGLLFLFLWKEIILLLKSMFVKFNFENNIIVDLYIKRHKVVSFGEDGWAEESEEDIQTKKDQPRTRSYIYELLRLLIDKILTQF